MILMIDNYDSFTYNLVQYFGELGADLKVYRNDALTVDDIRRMGPEKIVISPGPSNPDHAGISLDVIQHFKGQVPIFGVCLGHQCLGQAFGGKIVRAGKLMHGKTSQIRHNGKDVFKDVANPFEATRYHSLVIERKSIPACFEITAESEDNEIMGVSHRELPLWGVQFHPESILTTEGKKLLDNFLNL
ncbi:MAG: aminodeoxychorismate/anthranilate synthase component II [Candidatus Omnitrophica bacterium]|nr:aminodeoxychorismate/anthranilate synthase component II [Candidatus Omnitrophota bacterium]MCB9721331.1 aminodeoxychorismate/anthranilate synthase component II [Candidatus Omnitrophota bacterium]